MQANDLVILKKHLLFMNLILVTEHNMIFHSSIKVKDKKAAIKELRKEMKEMKADHKGKKDEKSAK